MLFGVILHERYFTLRYVAGTFGTFLAKKPDFSLYYLHYLHS